MHRTTRTRRTRRTKSYLTEKDPVRRALMGEIDAAIGRIQGETGETSVPKATSTKAGVILPGENVSLGSDGKLSVPTASLTAPGVVLPGNNLQFALDGTLEVPVADVDRPGVMKPGPNLLLENGVISVPLASDTTAGVVKVGELLNLAADGTISVPKGGDDNLGVLQVGDNLSVTDSVIHLTGLNVLGALGYTPESALGYTPVDVAGDTMTGLLITKASEAGGAGFRLPHGAAPSAPTDGDLWTTTSGLYARANATTYGPFLDASTGVASLNSKRGDVTLESADVTGALGYTPVNIAGDTMTGNLSFSNAANRSIKVEASAAGVAGRNIYIEAGDALAGTANLTGGYVRLYGGNSTGNGTSAIEFHTATPGTAGATTSNPVAQRGTIHSGGLDLSVPLRMGTTAVIDTSRNLNNIGTIASGAITATVAGSNSISARSGGAGSFVKLSVGRTADEVVIGVAGAANNFVNNSVAGDMAIVNYPTSGKLYIGRTSSADAAYTQVIGTNSTHVHNFSGLVQVGGTTVIDASRNGTFATLKVGTTDVSLAGHGHLISDVTGLQTALDGKADTHTHPYVPLAGGTMTGQLVLDTTSSLRMNINATDAITVSATSNGLNSNWGFNTSASTGYKVGGTTVIDSSRNHIGAMFTTGSATDLSSGSPWYGYGKTDITTLSSTPAATANQLAGFFGLRTRTNNAILDLYQAGKMEYTGGASSTEFRLHSTGNVILTLDADTDNLDETHHPEIRLLQDAQGIAASIGLAGTFVDGSQAGNHFRIFFEDDDGSSGNYLTIGVSSKPEAIKIRASDGFITMGGASSVYFTGLVNTASGFQVGGSTVIDTSRNASVAALTTSGTITAGAGSTMSIEKSGAAFFYAPNGWTGIDLTAAYARWINIISGAKATSDNIILSVERNDTWAHLLDIKGDGSVASAATVSGSTISGTNVTASNALQIGGTTVIDSSKNISIAKLTSAGHDILNGLDTWLRTKDSTGWYNSTHGGGMYMTDSTWVRTYSSKALRADNTIHGNNFQTPATHGAGYRFWESDNYKIYMSAVGSVTSFSEELDTASDYNIYYKIASSGAGATRGHVWYGTKSGTNSIMGHWTPNSLFVATGINLTDKAAVGSQFTSSLDFGKPNDVMDSANNTTGSEVGRYEIRFYGYRDVETTQIGAKIAAVRINNYGTGAKVQGTDLVFYTGVGSTGVSGNTFKDINSERVRIKNSGETNFAGAIQVDGTTIVDSSRNGTFASLKVGATDVSLSGHGHVISDVTGLQTALDGKADSHTHPYLPLGGGIMTGDLTLNVGTSGPKIAAIFGTNTRKSYISFSAQAPSNDPGYIMHEYSVEAGHENKGVIHICPTDDNDNTNDYVAIHGSNDPETIKLYTGGNISTTGGVSAASFTENGTALASKYAAIGHVGATGTAHGVATTSANGFMSSTDKSKLDGIAASANNYSHPTGDGNLHVPTTGTTSNGKVLMAGSTAGSAAWTTPPWTSNTGTVTSVGLSLPGIFTVTGSPVTGSGTLTATLGSQTAKTFFAAPNAAAGAPSFRAIVASDLPDLSATYATAGHNHDTAYATISSVSSKANVLTGERTSPIYVPGWGTKSSLFGVINSASASLLIFTITSGWDMDLYVDTVIGDTISASAKKIGVVQGGKTVLLPLPPNPGAVMKFANAYSSGENAVRFSYTQIY